MRLFTRIIALFGISLISLFVTRPVLAFPPIPSSFYGTVKVNGENVPDGTHIKALIKGQVFVEAQTQTYKGDSVYALDVPGDDLGTTVVEGGLENDSIVFTIEGTQADQAGTWKSGTNINLNLSISKIAPQNTAPSTVAAPAQASIKEVQQPAQSPPSAPQPANAQNVSRIIVGVVGITVVSMAIVIFWQIFARKPKNKH